jgi:hypothetical protein
VLPGQMYLVLNTTPALRTKTPRSRQSQSTLHTMSVHREPLLFGCAVNLVNRQGLPQPETLLPSRFLCP